MELYTLIPLALIGLVKGECMFDDRSAEPEPTGGDYNAVETSTLHLNFTWPNYGTSKRVVLYYFDPSFNRNSRNSAVNIFREFEAQGGCVRFFQVHDPEFRLKKLLISSASNKCKNRAGGSVSGTEKDTILQLTYNRCESGGDEWDGTFRHELFHAFGITHTHRRSDRDKYIKIKYENLIQSEKIIRQFDVCSTCTIPDEGNNPYECNSIMHYVGRAFSNSWDDTIVSNNIAKCPPGALRQYNNMPTPNDYKILRDVLQCGNW